MQTNLDRYISNLSCDDCPAKIFCAVATADGTRESCKMVLTKWAKTGRCADCRYCNKLLKANQCDVNRFIVQDDDSCPKWEVRE